MPIMFASNLYQSILSAVATNDLPKLGLLLAQCHHGDCDGWTPLHMASRHGNLSIAKLIVETNASVHATSKTSSTPLHEASFNGHLDVCKLLVDAGANVHAIKNEGSTALHLASFNGHFEVVTLLIEAGANVHATNRGGSTPLHFAASKGHLDIVRLLLTAGANVSVLDANGKTPEQLAIMSETDEVVELLSEAAKTSDARYTRQPATSQKTDFAQFHAIFSEQVELQRRYEELEERSAKMDLVVSTQHNQLMASYREIASLKTENDSWQTASRKTTAEHKQHCEQLQSSLQRAESAFAQQQYQLEQVEEQNNQLIDQVARLQTETAQTKAELAAARSASKTTVERLERRLADAKEERDEYIRKACALKGQITAMEHKLYTSTTCTTCDELREKLNRCTEENSRQQEIIRQLSERVAELQDTLERGYY